MKLHHTVFLLVFFVLFVFSCVILAFSSHDSFESALNTEKAKAVSEHKEMSSHIISRIKEKQIEKGGFMLLSDDIKSVIANEKQIGITALVKYQGELFYYNSIEEKDKAESLIDDSEISYLIYGSFDDEKSVYVCSAAEAGKRKVSFLTLHNIEGVFSTYRTKMINRSLLCALLSFVLSFLISLIIKLKTIRFKKINNALRSVSKGNYIVKVKPKGCYEARKLSDNINLMTDSVNTQAEKLKDISESRKRFVDNMAHEMKTPLTSIMCMADILRIKRNVKEKELRESANVIFEEATRMKSLSSKLLSLAETDSAAITKERVCTLDLFDDIRQAITPIADSSGVKLSFYCEKVYILVDIQLFKTMIFNLIDNAIKASESGNSVEVHCFAENRRVIIIVADHGIGMSETDLKHATEPFYRADKARSRKKGGVGLGLSLCVSIAKQHNAVFDIKSEKGVGTVVKIETEEYDGEEMDEKYE